MITFKNITDEEHKNILQEMLKAHYRELYGENWEVKNFFQRFKDSRSLSTYHTERDMSELFVKPLYGTVAYGIFNDDNIIGFILLDCLNPNKQHSNINTYGQVYQLYIKPEHRLTGKRQKEFFKLLNDYIKKYFSEKGINEVLTEIPDDIQYLIECGQALGFSQVEKSTKESGISTSLWQKTI